MFAAILALSIGPAPVVADSHRSGCTGMSQSVGVGKQSAGCLGTRTALFQRSRTITRTRTVAVPAVVSVPAAKPAAPAAVPAPDPAKETPMPVPMAGPGPVTYPRNDLAYFTGRVFGRVRGVFSGCPGGNCPR